MWNLGKNLYLIEGIDECSNALTKDFEKWATHLLNIIRHLAKPKKTLNHSSVCWIKNYEKYSHCMLWLNECVCVHSYIWPSDLKKLRHEMWWYFASLHCHVMFIKGIINFLLFIMKIPYTPLYFRYIIFHLCTLIILTMCSCQTAHSERHRWPTVHLQFTFY